ncbi:molecular chaperone [Companilactobacillus crustorum]|jgi:Molecular chaperone (small heat shock protein)|uniref:Hsp20 family heat-shock protein n=3 Tax=Companilactobacillus TaxID=2767879 RepID=A0A837RK08_9LACO|nr:Hsp20/alpha crystallin family protein [Companilactobacillus crustorum]HCD07298.1 Hsp20/alpha crystallin family protein [Lactobacillus sp.]APU70545.1 Heat shock protein HSP.16.4 [Companilactobacillus crustorum]KRK43373.1 Hsp20 family heat-shock protein [Companilactobacillus crustorum JCM 15951]KRO20922.1 Hsp20 family heat-shock protein [Companilactobacillus crustorum]WDT65297.1 Hsp20/alpha crystallin family protein [Companilactobacillus crustorum]
MTNEIMDRNNLMRNWFNSDNWANNFPSIFDNNFPDDSTLRTDIKETDKNYEVHVDMPAFDKKDIDINYENDILTVSGHRDSFNDHNDKNGDMIMSERSSGRFMRQYHLPAVNTDNIKATYDNGVLKVVLPKLEDKVDSGHHIDID